MKKILLFAIALFAGFCMSLSADDSGERKEALRRLIERAESGNPKALYDLAVLHDTGYDTIPVDSLKSSVLYRLSAETGYAPAQNYLGFLYFNGKTVKQDVDSALYWLAKAAGAGDIKAANNLGFLLANSDIVSRDYKQAVYWLTRASDAGLPAASATLGDLYRQGLGVKTDTVEAARLYDAAIDGGLLDAELKLLGMMGNKWKQLPADSALAIGKHYYLRNAPAIGVTLFERAAELHSPQAYALLGDAYSRGIGVEYDHSKAVAYFLRGALAGEPASTFVIGELLDIFPDALDDDYALEVLEEVFPAEIPDEVYDARYWYEIAASQGITDAETAYDVLFR